MTFKVRIILHTYIYCIIKTFCNCFEYHPFFGNFLFLSLYHKKHFFPLKLCYKYDSVTKNNKILVVNCFTFMIFIFKINRLKRF